MAASNDPQAISISASAPVSPVPTRIQMPPTPIEPSPRPSAHGGVLAAMVVACVALLLCVSPARAQSGASLLVKPWDKDQLVEDETDGYIFNGGHTSQRESGHDFQLSSIESSGRVRILPGNVASPRLGYDFTLLNARTRYPGFPHQLIDASVAGGTFLNKTNGWVTGITLGVGYAGDSPFGRGTGWYGKADFVLAKEFSENDAIGIGIDYDGNRTLLPDAPLPGFGYSHRFDPRLKMVFGLPVTSIDWKPIDRLLVHLDYLLVEDLDVDIGYEFIPHWTVYGGFQTRRDAFHAASLRSHQRLFFLQRRAEVGLRFVPGTLATVTLAAGYGFDGEFRTGWDLRDTGRYLRFSDEPYLRAGVELRF